MIPFLPLALIAFAILAVKNHRLAFFVFCGLLPTYLIRIGAGGLPTTALELAFLILLAAWMWKREKRLIDISGWRLILLYWIIVATVSMFVAPDFRAAAGIWKAYFIEPILFFLIANDVMRTQQDRLTAIKALAFSAIAVAAMSLLQKFAGAPVPPPWNDPEQFRTTSFYGYPNASGLFLAPLIPLFIWARRPLTLVAAALSLVAIILAENEGAWIALMPAAFFAGVMFRKTRVVTIGLAAMAIIAALVAPPARSIIIEKLTLEDWSGRVRKEMWAETWSMLKDRPILGAGLSGYPTVFAPYHKAGHIEIFQYPHQIFLNFWVETGLAGVLILMITAFTYFKTSREACDDENHPWLIALSSSMIVLLVHSLVDVPYFKNDLAMLFWLLIAFMSSTAAEVKKSGR